MYDAVTAMIAQSKELEQLAAGTQPQPPPQQQAQRPAQQQQQAQPHHQRRLMSASDSSSSISSGDTLVEPFALNSSSAGPTRHLMQAASGQAGGSQAAGGAPAVVPGVEADPKHAGLTQEALDSFKVFEDVPADAASTAGDAASAAGDAASQAAGDGTAAVNAAGGDLAGVEQGGNAALAQEQHHTRATDYDEFGDAWKADLWKQTHGKCLLACNKLTVLLWLCAWVACKPCLQTQAQGWGSGPASWQAGAAAAYIVNGVLKGCHCQGGNLAVHWMTCWHRVLGGEPAADGTGVAAFPVQEQELIQKEGRALRCPPPLTGCLCGMMRALYR
jgi:hypothetical protein